MEPFSLDEVASINNELNYLKDLIRKDIDSDMHISCGVLRKHFQEVEFGMNKCDKLDFYNKDLNRLRKDTADLCKSIENTINRSENISRE